MKDEHYNEILKKLDIMIKLLSLQSLGDKKGRESITLLSKFGLQPKEIAEIIGTTPNTVSVTLNEMKKKGGKSGRKEKE